MVKETPLKSLGVCKKKRATIPMRVKQKIAMRLVNVRDEVMRGMVKKFIVLIQTPKMRSQSQIMY